MVQEIKKKEIKEIEKKPQENYFKDLIALPKYMMKWIDNSYSELVIVWNNKGVIFFVSKSVTSLLGYDPNDLVGKLWFDLISQEDISKIQEHMTETSNDHTCKQKKIKIRNHQGEYILFELLIEKVKGDHHSSEEYYFCILRDMSHKLKSQEMLIRSEKMSVAGQLAAGIAHEIRNPLTSLKGFLQLLQSGVNQKEAYYKIMLDEIDKLESITSELLFMSKPLTNHKKVESITSMIEDVMVLLKSQAKLKNIEIQRAESKELYIYCDRSQIKQVLVNLVKNAIEAMESSGTIKINVTNRHSHIELDVIDEGLGIPESVLHKINEPFFTTKQGGTGLGLMISKQILENHQGEMKILQNKTKGSTFRLVFPAVQK